MYWLLHVLRAILRLLLETRGREAPAGECSKQSNTHGGCVVSGLSPIARDFRRRKKLEVYDMAKRNVTQSTSKGKQAPPSKRFDFAIDDDDFQELSKCFVPANTAADTRKCVCLFQEWAKERNLRFKEDKVPEDILVTDDHQSLCHWLCKFCTEIRKVDGTHYPPRSIQH